MGSAVFLTASNVARALPDPLLRLTPRRSLEKFDALCQRQVTSPVHGRRLPPHVRLPGIGSGLAPATRVLLAAERATDLRAARSPIHVGDSAVRTGGGDEPLRRAHAVGEDCARQSL